MNIDYINGLSPAAAEEQFHRCCGSRKFAAALVRRRPFADPDTARRAASEIWLSLGEEDWLEAFSHHPRIGEKQLAERFASTANWSSGEQSGTSGADPDTIRRLAEGNDAYEKKFGFVFLICATGKSAAEMLEAQQKRLGNTRDVELLNAAREQDQITHLRLDKIAAAEAGG